MCALGMHVGAVAYQPSAVYVRATASEAYASESSLDEVIDIPLRERADECCVRVPSPHESPQTRRRGQAGLPQAPAYLAAARCMRVPDVEEHQHSTKGSWALLMVECERTGWSIYMHVQTEWEPLKTSPPVL